jgi:hypothetical protein
VRNLEMRTSQGIIPLPPPNISKLHQNLPPKIE